MNDLIDEHLFNLFEGIRQTTTGLFGEFISDAQALAAVFMLLYFGIKSFEMISGDKKLEIMPLLRPFALGLVLMFWIPFVEVISYPGEVFARNSKNMFNDQLTDVEMLSRNRYALVDSVSLELANTVFEIEWAEDEAKDKAWYDFGIDIFEGVGKSIGGLYVYVVSKFRLLLLNIAEFGVVTFWQFCVYFVFFLQIIFTAVLIILGPLAFAFSVLPAFWDSYINWLSRFISVSLYSSIAYIVLSVSLVLVRYALETEIDTINHVLNNEAAFIMYVGMSSGGVNSFMVTLLVGAFAMLTIPIISTWVVATSGVGQAVGGFVGGAALATKGMIK